MRSKIKRLVKEFGNLRRYRQKLKTYKRFRKYTMISPETYANNLIVAEFAASIEGMVVECGVWRGGMIAGIASDLGPHRTYHLFDSFEGLPPAKAIDGQSAIDWQGDKLSPRYFDNCSAPESFAKEAMELAGAKHFHLHKGWFNETVPTFHPDEPIAILRLDGDWYESTMLCLDSLFHSVATGGLIILDDYYAWDGCARAVHDFLSKNSCTERIVSFSGGCYLVKASPSALNTN